MYWRTALLLLTVSLSWAKDYYELLGLKRDADHRDIRKAFKKLAVTLHPDKNKDDPEAHERFMELMTAYEALKDPELRKKYDLFGEEGLNNANKQQHKYHSWNYYQNNFGIYDDDPQVVTLNRDDYDENVVGSDRIWFINFYSPMCTHCHHLAPVWRRIAKDFEGVIRIGAVNCEDDWQLCHRIGIKSYPTLLHYPKNSNHGVRFTGVKSFEAIARYVLDKLDLNIRKITESVWDKLLKGTESPQKPTLVFTCCSGRNCFSPDDQLKITAIFDKIMNIRLYMCKESERRISEDTAAVYLPAQNEESWEPVFFDYTEDVNEIIGKILEELPEPQDLSASEFEETRAKLELGSETGWLICFYIGHATELDLQLKKLPSMLHDISLGKVHCGRNPSLCRDLNVNHYPMWGVLKPGGTFELNHGKDTVNHIADFARNSIKAQNVHALSSEEILSIMRAAKDSEVWFIDWYAPWCPPCLRFLPELRKASLHMDRSIVRFGTVDCTVHSTICRQYNIRSYPTAMLVNNSATHLFNKDKTATSILEFIEELRNPIVISLTADNFYETVGRKKSAEIWVVEYFAPWCGPCQQLQPHWTIVAKTLQQVGSVKVAAVNCESDSSLCSAQGISSYPTIRLYPSGSKGLNTVALHNGQRDSLSLLKWIAEFLPAKVEWLDENSFERKVISRKEIWLVDFFASWCDHCHRLEPHFVVAAQLLNPRVKFGKINCEVQRGACAKAGVRAYPTVMLYRPRQHYRNEYQGDQINTASASTIVESVEDILSSISKLERDEL